MTDLATLLQYEFFRNALWASLIAGLLCGVVGTFVVVKRLVFLSGGIAHASFGGLGAAFFFGFDPALGALTAALLVAAGLGQGGERWQRSHDAAIGVLWAVGTAIGIAFVAATPGYAPNLNTYLFGNVLLVPRTEVLWMALVGTGALVVIAVLFKEFVALAVDEPFARVQGLPVRALRTLLYALIALTIALLLRTVGMLLVIALVTIPPLIALNRARGFARALWLAAALGVIVAVGGLLFSYACDLPSGATVILWGASLLGLERLIPRGRRSGML